MYGSSEIARGFRSRMLRILMAAATGLAMAASGSIAQEDEFDISRFRSNNDRWIPFDVEETVSLGEAVSAGILSGETALLILEVPTGRLALVEDQLTYHHAAQGRLNGEPWMVSY